MTSQHDPSISVVMPVHNALPYLDAAVQSILGQTKPDFEFVIYDDGSTDGSAEKLEEWERRDSRIKLFRGKSNLGPAKSSNRVVEYASAPLIARMDADDLSSPDRLEHQFQILSENPDVGIVASLCDVIDASGRKLRGPEFWRLARKSWLTPFSHGSMMFRRELYDSIGGYRDECEFWEDLDFVIRASEASRILVLPSPLYCYRQLGTSTRLTSKEDRVENALDLRYRSIARVRRNSDYDDLLRSGRRQSHQRVDPRVFISLGSLALWSGQRPKVLRRFLSRARFRIDRATVIAIVWVSWASVSPGTLRAFMNLLSRLRNATLSKKPPLDEPVEWQTPSKRDRLARAEEKS